MKELHDKIRELEAYIGPSVGYSLDHLPELPLSWIVEYYIFLKNGYYQRRKMLIKTKTY